MFLGIVLFTGVDVHGADAASGAAFGFALILVGLLLEALLSNLEEKWFFRCAAPAPRQEVVACMSAFAALYAGAAMLLTGAEVLVRGVQELLGRARVLSSSCELGACAGEAAGSLRVDWRHADVWATIALSALAGYGAMSVILRMIDCFGVTTTEVIKSVRKVLQVLQAGIGDQAG